MYRQQCQVYRWRRHIQSDCRCPVWSHFHLYCRFSILWCLSSRKNLIHQLWMLIFLYKLNFDAQSRTAVIGWDRVRVVPLFMSLHIYRRSPRRQTGSHHLPFFILDTFSFLFFTCFGTLFFLFSRWASFAIFFFSYNNKTNFVLR